MNGEHSTSMKVTQEDTNNKTSHVHGLAALILSKVILFLYWNNHVITNNLQNFINWHPGKKY